MTLRKEEHLERGQTVFFWHERTPQLRIQPAKLPRAARSLVGSTGAVSNVPVPGFRNAFPNNGKPPKSIPPRFAFPWGRFFKKERWRQTHVWVLKESFRHCYL